MMNELMVFARKKPILVTAELFCLQKDVWPAGVYQSIVDHKYYIETLEGTMQVQPGSWIITGNFDERWAIRGDIFAKTYEVVDL